MKVSLFISTPTSLHGIPSSTDRGTSSIYGMYEGSLVSTDHYVLKKTRMNYTEFYRRLLKYQANSRVHKLRIL